MLNIYHDAFILFFDVRSQTFRNYIYFESIFLVQHLWCSAHFRLFMISSLSSSCQNSGFILELYHFWLFYWSTDFRLRFFQSWFWYISERSIFLNFLNKWSSRNVFLCFSSSLYSCAHRSYYKVETGLIK